MFINLINEIINLNDIKKTFTKESLDLEDLKKANKAISLVCNLKLLAKNTVEKLEEIEKAFIKYYEENDEYKENGEYDDDYDYEYDEE